MRNALRRTAIILLLAAAPLGLVGTAHASETIRIEGLTQAGCSAIGGLYSVSSQICYWRG